MKAILAKKIMQTRIFDEAGMQIPVTLVRMEQNIVSQVKSSEKDGYTALQIAAAAKKKLNKPEAGHLNKVKEGLKARVLYEIKTQKSRELGEALTIDEFEEGEIVNVTGVSKGKGFAGTVKRHNFNLGPKTHGSHNYRQPGSIGATYPERVIKGRRMAGHMGNQKTTVKNLKIVKIDKDLNELLIKGAVPGPKQAFVLIWSHNEG